MAETHAIKQVIVTLADGTTKTFHGKGSLYIYSTDIREEVDSNMTVLEAHMKVDK